MNCLVGRRKLGINIGDKERRGWRDGDKCMELGLEVKLVGLVCILGRLYIESGGCIKCSINLGKDF